MDIVRPAMFGAETQRGGERGVPQPGDVLAGKYRVERLLGVGGMGVVVAAQHVELGQTVAVKLMLPSVGVDAVAVERFLREARAAARIQSDHVVRVFDVGKLESGAPYMVMEMLRGADLAEVLHDRGSLSVGDAVDYVLQACDALAQAHAMGIVHRDLKPSNLFLATRSDGAPLVKVLDFGISKSTAQGADAPGAHALTATNTVMGSPMYMSPEQVRNSKQIDGRSDIWSLGIILHELLSGAPAFRADTLPGICAAIIADSPAPLRELRPDAPGGLLAVVDRCLEKDASRRYASIGELAAALVPFAVRSTVPTSLRREPTASLDEPQVGAVPPPRDSHPVAFQSTVPPPLHPPVASPRAPGDPLAASAAPMSRSSPVARAGDAPPSGRRRGALVAGLVATALAVVVGTWAALRPDVQPGRGAPDTSAAASASAPRAKRGYTLFVDSMPTGAQVLEAGRVLGTTPLQLWIDNDGVGASPRTLVVDRPGYQPYSIVQGPSEDNVRVVAPLVPVAPVAPGGPSAAAPAHPAASARAQGGPSVAGVARAVAAPSPSGEAPPAPPPTRPPAVAPTGKDIVLER